VWLRQARVLFGSSIISTSLVLAAFMGGNSVGSLITILLQKRMTREKKWLGLGLLSTGMAGILLTLILPQLVGILSPVFKISLGSVFFLNFVRLTAAFVLLLIPTACMGATLPLVIKCCESKKTFSDEEFARKLGLLYSVNTAGGVAGALLGEFILFETLGLSGSAITACLAVEAVGIVLLHLSRSDSLSSNEQNETEANQTENAFDQTSAMRFVAVTAIIWFCFMSLEILWLRFLSLFIFPASPTFAIILAAILMGLIIGSAIYSLLIIGKADPEHSASFLVAISSLWVTCSYLFFDRFFPALSTRKLISIPDLAPAVLFLSMPVAISTGILFPLAAQLIKSRFQSSLVSAEILSSAGMIGSTIGPVFTGLILIPWLGVEKSFFLISAILLASSFITGNRPPASSRMLYHLRLFFIAAAIFALAVFPFGKMKSDYALSSLSPETRQSHEIIEVKEGLGETIVLVEEKLFGLPLNQKIFTNGFSMSGTNHYSRRYMSMFAILPLVLHPACEKALLICYGAGVTARALTSWAELKKIKIVDISPDIVEISKRLITSGKNNPLNDPRVDLLIDDGRFYLQTTDEKYDLITAEPPPPKHDGVGSLYSLDYFKQVFNCLNSGGYFSLWLPVNQISLDDTKAILKAFLIVFPDASLWSGAGPDLVLLGYKAPARPVSQARFDQPWLNPEYKPILKDIFLEKPPQLAACFLMGAEDMGRLVGDYEPLTDDFPFRLSPFSSPDRSPEIGTIMQPNVAMNRFLNSGFVRKVLPSMVINAACNWYPFQKIHFLALSKADWEMAFDVLYNSLILTDLEILPLYVMGIDPEFMQLVNEYQINPNAHPVLPLYLGAEALAKRDYAKAVSLIKFPEQTTRIERSLMARIAGFRIIALILAGQKSEARDFLQSLLIQTEGKLFPENVQKFFFKLLE
ncbi:MAG: hypothetical protein ACOYXC_05900, partial [Candidatus Rifleibacteriota bacterium]